MTHPEHTPASRADPDRPSAEERDPRAARARTEPMTVRALRGAGYLVETDGGSYVVDLDGGSCECPDHEIRGTRCKHLRRVAMAVTGGDVPPPGRRHAACAVCGATVAVDRCAAGPQLCRRHRPAVGDLVVDRETGDRLVVVGPPGERADAAAIDDGRLVAAVPTNAHYGGHEPVVPAVYVDSLRAGDDLAAATRYRFPASRLRATGRRHGAVSAAVDGGDLADPSSA